MYDLCLFFFIYSNMYSLNIWFSFTQECVFLFVSVMRVVLKLKWCKVIDLTQRAQFQCNVGSKCKILTEYCTYCFSLIGNDLYFDMHIYIADTFDKFWVGLFTLREKPYPTLIVLYIEVQNRWIIQI